MLAEGFLRLLPYREEGQSASASTLKSSHTHAPCVDRFKCTVSDSNSAEQQSDSAEAGPDQGEPLSQFQGLKVVPEVPLGLSIPGCPSDLILDPDFALCLERCSLLEHYPDLQVADSGRIPPNPQRLIIGQHNLISEVCHQPIWAIQQEPQDEPLSLVPDQGYLVMGASVNTSLDLPGPGCEPMSNSVLNGLLDKQLEEVYMQHLTDNLARCNSHLGNSLLQGLVPPPQPSSQLRGPDSLEASLEEQLGVDSGRKISYLHTQNLVPCSSNFSSPVLRISETDNAHLQ